MGIANLREGSLVLWRWHDGQLAGDFRLPLTMPEGDEDWTLGPGILGPVEQFAGRGLSIFEVQMRSWFDDHMSDLAERGHGPDRTYDDLPVGYDVPADLLRILEGGRLPD
jgi:hypothetical protein